MFMFYQAREVVFILPAYWGGGWTVWGTNPEGLSSSWADAGNFLLFSLIFSHISLSRMNFLAFRFHWYAGHCENQIQLGALSLSWTNAGPDLFIIWTLNLAQCTPSTWLCEEKPVSWTGAFSKYILLTFTFHF